MSAKGPRRRWGGVDELVDMLEEMPDGRGQGSAGSPAKDAKAPPEHSRCCGT